jgi:hypothetical protein
MRWQLPASISAQNGRGLEQFMLSLRFGEDMTQRWMGCSVPLLFVVVQALMGQNDLGNSGSWSGVIVNGNCTPGEAFAEAAKCTEDLGPAAKLALYDDTIRAVYTLDPQDQAVGHLGDSVTVEGTLQNNKIQVTSIKMLTAIGLNVGEKAPAFSARDQFGQEQNLATLKGPKGTVLLFFRSADW